MKLSRTQRKLEAVLSGTSAVSMLAAGPALLGLLALLAMGCPPSVGGWPVRAIVVVVVAPLFLGIAATGASIAIDLWRSAVRDWRGE